MLQAIKQALIIIMCKSTLHWNRHVEWTGLVSKLGNFFILHYFITLTIIRNTS